MKEWKSKSRVDNIYPAATAKSLQSCPTLCDPIDGSPPGSPIPVILQARTLEWVAISFSNVYPSRMKRNKKSEDKHWKGICFFPLLWQKKKKKCFEPRKLVVQKDQSNIDLHILYIICNCKPDSKKSLCFKYRSKLCRVSGKYFYA